MKKFRYLLSMLAFVLVFAGASKAMPTAAADSNPIDAVGCVVDYNNEVVYVDAAATTIYYQVVKSAEIATVKANAWLPVTVQVEYADDDDRFVIDISAFTKSGFIAVALDPNATDKKDFKVVSIVAPVKSLKVTLDFFTDAPANLYDALASAVASNVDTSINATYTLDSTDTTKRDRLEDFLGVYTLAWKRGANGVWKTANQANTWTVDEDFSVAYQMMRASNSTLYVRVVAAKTASDGAKGAVLASKEVKVKIPKTAAAPALKINYQTGIIPLKNGQEIYDPSVEATYAIPAYDKNSEIGTTWGAASSKTKKKVTGITVQELIDCVEITRDTKSIDRITPGNPFTVKYRTSATAKKYASYYGTLTLKAPVSYPAAKASTTFSYTVNAAKQSIVVDLSNVDAVDGRTLEYAIAAASNADGGVNMAALKWTAVPEGNKIDLSKFYGKTAKYKATDNSTKEIKYENATVYYRWAAVVDKTDATKNLFPGNYAYITPVAAATVTAKFTVVTTDKVEFRTADGKNVLKDNVTVTKNEDYKFTVKVKDSKYTIVEVKNADEKLTPEDGVYTIKLTADAEIKVTVKQEFELEFTPNGATVAVTVPSGVTLTDNKAKFTEGTEVKFTVAAPSGKAIDSVKAGDTVLTAASGVYTVTVDAAKTVVITLKDAE